MATPNTQQPQPQVVPPAQQQQAVHAVPPGYAQQPAQPAVQPVYVPVQVPAQTQAQMTPQQIVHEEKQSDVEPLEVKLISHTTLFYWWPVWAVGFLMAFLTYMQGRELQVGEKVGEITWDYVHTSSNLGIIYFLTLFVVILITNIKVRGLASGMVILSMVIVTLLLAYFELWDDLFAAMGNLKIHLNLGAYLAFSTLLLLTWLVSVFVFDRIGYYRIRAGQITYEYMIGAGSKSWDADNMALEKHRDDLFRHWLLGLGSGDLEIHTGGARSERLYIPNVLLIGGKVEAIQRLIAMQPDEFGHATIK